MSETDFERLGGEHALRAIISDFVDACFDDLMIGFHFRRASRERVKRFEYEHAAVFLGADIAYEGRTIRDAHRAHVILGGHFVRRLEILKQTLKKHFVPGDVIARWLAHHEALRDEVTADPGSECGDRADPDPPV